VGVGVGGSQPSPPKPAATTSAAPATTSAAATPTQEPSSDEDICKQAAAAKNGFLFTDLFAGRFDQYYHTQSEADQSLMNLICDYTDSKVQAARIFHQSELGKRDKADRDDYLNSPTYGLITKAWDTKLPPVDLRFDNGAPIGPAPAAPAPVTPPTIDTGIPLPTSAAPPPAVPLFNPFIFKLASEYTPRPVEWIWKNHLARRKMTILAGMPGTGKSMITDSMIATNSNAAQWPDGSGYASGGFSKVRTP
jgi:hypothetical protein